MRDHARIGVLAHGDSAFRRATDELARDLSRLGDAILPAGDGTEHVVGAKTAHTRRVDVLDGNAEVALHRGALAQSGETALRRRDEHVADLLEERPAELPEQRRTVAREANLGRRRKLLAESTHRLAGGAARDLADVGEHDVARVEQREVVRDRRPYGAGAGNDDSSHASSSFVSSAASVRSGRRTSGRTGRPRHRSTVFNADWKGNRCTASRTRPRSAAGGSRTAAATSSGNAEPSAETAPTAPASIPCGISASGPTKTSSPSSRYGAKRSHGVSDTLRPRKFGAASRSRSTTSTGTA